jgi:hypothetical protein
MTSEKVIDENTWRRQECRKFIAEVMEVLHIPPIYYSITERGMGGVYAKSALPFRVQFDGVGRGIIEPNSIYTNIKSAIKYAYKENYIQRKMVKVDYFKSQMHLNRSVWGEDEKWRVKRRKYGGHYVDDPSNYVNKSEEERSVLDNLQISALKGGDTKWFPIYLDTQKNIDFFLWQEPPNRGASNPKYMIYKTIKMDNVDYLSAWTYEGERPVYFQCIMNPENSPASVWCNVYRAKGSPVTAMESAMEEDKSDWSPQAFEVDFIYTPLKVKKWKLLNWDGEPWRSK